MTQKKKYCLVAVIVLLMICFSVETYKAFYGTEKSDLSPQERIAQWQKDLYDSCGLFMQTNPHLMDKQLADLADQSKKQDAVNGKMIAQVNGWPISWDEFSYCVAINKIFALGSSDYDYVFNQITDQKVLLSYALDNNLIPNKKKVWRLIKSNMRKYDKSDEYKAQIDGLIAQTGISQFDYWQCYQFYIHFHYLILENSYKSIIKEAEKTDQLSSKASEEEKDQYFDKKLLELKKKADLKMIYQGNFPGSKERQLQPDLTKNYLLEQYVALKEEK